MVSGNGEGEEANTVSGESDEENWEVWIADRSLRGVDSINAPGSSGPRLGSSGKFSSAVLEL